MNFRVHPQKRERGGRLDRGAHAQGHVRHPVEVLVLQEGFHLSDIYIYMYICIYVLVLQEGFHLGGQRLWLRFRLERLGDASNRSWHAFAYTVRPLLAASTLGSIGIPDLSGTTPSL